MNRRARTALALAMTPLLASMPMACDSGGDEGTDIQETLQEESWSAELPEEIGVARVAQAADSSVVVKAENGLAVIDGASGAVRWWQSFADEDTEVALAGDLVTLSWIDSDYTGVVRVFDIATGQEQVTMTDMADLDDIVITSDSIVTTTSLYPWPMSGLVQRVTSFDVATGAQRWQVDIPGYSNGHDLPRSRTGYQSRLTAQPTDLTPFAWNRLGLGRSRCWTPPRVDN